MAHSLSVYELEPDAKQIYFHSLKSMSIYNFRAVSRKLCEDYRPKRSRDFPTIADFRNYNQEKLTRSFNRDRNWICQICDKPHRDCNCQRASLVHHASEFVDTWPCPCEACRVRFDPNDERSHCDCDLGDSKRMGQIGFLEGQCYSCMRCRVHCTCDKMTGFLDSVLGGAIKARVKGFGWR